VFASTSKAALARYQRIRPDELPQLIDRLCRVFCIPNISVDVDVRQAHGIHLTSDGVTLNFNDNATKSMALNNAPGAKGQIPLAIADTLVALHQLLRIQDLLDPSFFVEQEPDSGVENFGWYKVHNYDDILHGRARRFFNHKIDEICADYRLRQLPLAKRYFQAFSTRLLGHKMTGLPQHIQFLNCLHLLVAEDNPDIQGGEAALQTACRLMDDGLAEVLAAESYALRHSLADELIHPIYLAFMGKDEQTLITYLMLDEYDGQLPYGKVYSTSETDLRKAREEEDNAYEELLFETAMEMVLESEIDSRVEIEEVVEESSDYPGLMLPRTGQTAEDLTILEGQALEYKLVAVRWKRVIDGVADVLLALAQPQENIVVPRYKARLHTEGVRINPTALLEAQIQLETEMPQGIWQPIRKIVRHQELLFSGLDIYLLLDVSASMTGVNADYSTAMCVCLIEGLQLARSAAALDQRQGEVDVRIQLLAFGEDWAELTDLSYTPSQLEKELAFYNLTNPVSNFTMINGALRHVRNQALAVPDRDVLCLVVSDGLFSDSMAALGTVHSMPPNASVGQISIGEETTVPITPHCKRVTDPKVLPRKLYAILEDRLRQRDSL
jgi:hypothetical protein